MIQQVPPGRVLDNNGQVLISQESLATQQNGQMSPTTLLNDTMPMLLPVLGAINRQTGIALH
jgi:hypothetical protein